MFQSMIYTNFLKNINLQFLINKLLEAFWKVFLANSSSLGTAGLWFSRFIPFNMFIYQLRFPFLPWKTTTFCILSNFLNNFQNFFLNYLKSWWFIQFKRKMFSKCSSFLPTFSAFPTNLFIKSNSFIDFHIFFQPTPLFHPSCLLGTVDHMGCAYFL